MNNKTDNIFKAIIGFFSLLSISILFLIIIFISKESLNFFKEVRFLNFITGKTWNPISSNIQLSILPIILGSLYTSLIAILISLPISIGCSIALSGYLGKKSKRFIKSFLDILVGIPSVVYGFIGLLVLVKFFESHFNMSSGESVLAGGILLSIMITPYIVSSATETMEKVFEKYIKESKALGVSKEYFIRNILIKESKRGILAGTILALGRSMGETMAVMMVIGNAPIFPKLFGKCQTIPSLIALEMGMAEVGSIHYYGLFASGFILLLILLIINTLFYLLRKKIKI